MSMKSATAVSASLRPVRLIRSAGGVMALPELAEALVALRGTAQEEPGARARLASALVRVAYEAEQAKAEPKLHLRRSERGLLLAVTPELAEYAERLGEVADALGISIGTVMSRLFYARQRLKAELADRLPT